MHSSLHRVKLYIFRVCGGRQTVLGSTTNRTNRSTPAPTRGRPTTKSASVAPTTKVRMRGRGIASLDRMISLTAI